MMGNQFMKLGYDVLNEKQNRTLEKSNHTQDKIHVNGVYESNKEWYD